METDNLNTPQQQHQPYKHLKQRTPGYFRARMKCSVTASEIKRLLMGWSSQSFAQFFHQKRFKISPPPINTPAIQNGINEEPNAADIYETLFIDADPNLSGKVTLEETGLWLHPKWDFIGASPDRLEIDKETKEVLRCIEIKCPTSEWKDHTSLYKHLKDWIAQIAVQEMCVQPKYPSRLVVYEKHRQRFWVYEIEFAEEFKRKLLVRMLLFNSYLCMVNRMQQELGDDNMMGTYEFLEEMEAIKVKSVNFEKVGEIKLLPNVFN